MKKIFLILFVGFICFIFYQMILGENGIIEGYRAKKNRERLLYYKNLLEKQSMEQANFIKYLKTNPKAYKDLAEKYGFFEEEFNFLKIVDVTKLNSKKSNFKTEEAMINLLIEFDKKNKVDEDIKNIKTILTICFFIFFGFFIILIILVGQKNE